MGPIHVSPHLRQLHPRPILRECPPKVETARTTLGPPPPGPRAAPASSAVSSASSARTTCSSAWGFCSCPLNAVRTVPRPRLEVRHRRPDPRRPLRPTPILPACFRSAAGSPASCALLCLVDRLAVRRLRRRRGARHGEHEHHEPRRPAVHPQLPQPRLPQAAVAEPRLPAAPAHRRPDQPGDRRRGRAPVVHRQRHRRDRRRRRCSGRRRSSSSC